MEQQSPVRPLENLHILLWLLKDICWVMMAEVPGLLMIIPTLFLAMRITWLSRNNRADLYHNLAIVFWIMANSTWMVGEFFFNDGWRAPAKIFFVAGLLVVSWYYYSEWSRNRADSKKTKA